MPDALRSPAPVVVGYPSSPFRHFSRSTTTRILSSDLIEDYWQDVDAEAQSAYAFRRMLDATDTYYEQSQEALNGRFTFSDEEDLEHFTDIINNVLMKPMTEAFDSTSASFFIENLPEEAFEGELEEIVPKLSKLFAAWLWKSDSGLMLRTQTELAAIEHGYEVIFWPKMASEPLMPQLAEGLVINCSLPEGERVVETSTAETKKAGKFW
mgnify:CR=1 FL=1